jgi:glucan biosynthesis protein C
MATPSNPVPSAVTGGSAPDRSTTPRSYYVDWLRLLATFIVFLYHSSRPFNALENWHVKNPQVSYGFDAPMPLFGLWMMPLFFVLSGISTYYALRSRSAGSFLRSRFLRLGVPLIGLGWFVLSPPQVYIERVTATLYHTTPFHGTFLQFIPKYFTWQYGAGGSFAFTGMHLWYLFWLLVFSCLALPLLKWLLGGAGRRLLDTLAQWALTPGLILLPGLPLCMFEVLRLKGWFLGQQEGGWYLPTYLILLVFSFILASDERFMSAIDRHKGVALILAVITDVLVFGPEVGPVLPEVARLFSWVPRALAPVVKTWSSWLWLIAVLGYGRKYLRSSNRLLAYAGPAVLPFYMLHQTVIVIIAYFMRGWTLALGLKYLFVVCVAFAVCMGLYEFAIRRSRALRFLFGMPAGGGG